MFTLIRILQDILFVFESTLLFPSVIRLLKLFSVDTIFTKHASVSYQSVQTRAQYLYFIDPETDYNF